MTRPTPLSGFPEWLPGQRIIEAQLVDRLRGTFELHGFAPLTTRAVEPMEQLLRKGETSKEVYVLRRLQADAEDATDSGLGLHFDLTVPFARYVVENAGKLQFPFRRYQIQPAWRGERPQEGRYREFLQADIDVVDRDELPLHHDVEVVLAAADALSRLPIPPVRIRTNNRKICEGFYRGLGIADPAAALRAVDKLDKIGREAVAKLLVETAGASDAQADACLALGEINSEDVSFVDRVRELKVDDPLLDEGLAELVAVVEAASEHTPGVVVADLSIARGLDYYTGTVYEIALPGFGMSIGAGGRYDNLASAGADRYPGVGISIGVTRLLGVLFGRDALSVSRPVPTCVLVALPAESSRPAADRIATALRRRGIATEVSPDAAKFGKQIRYAQRRGVPYVWFPGEGGDEVKDIRSGEQVAADAATWTPPAADLAPAITTQA
ncbi:histidine--tRNA ligase [Natronosporangium hydrolyticum]|uniref:Histidine--tRNA ligase n=1 Tax=Natronosporangium hydrolyticum TaxID=2811111 RepID=A0A895YSE5_9ACTN|nr:histidine--tRNA ligase [Natronosporangium hydrolyticum]QSB16938.1 histidine--tRNA ligase [Natronosporangium hydrolyticum]